MLGSCRGRVGPTRPENARLEPLSESGPGEDIVVRRLLGADRVVESREDFLVIVAI